MMVAANSVLGCQSNGELNACARERDGVIDTMRGIAILMVIAIHSLPKADGSAFVTAVEATLRPCVPIFLFASGYLTAQTGSVPLTKRIMRALRPYSVAFVAAYAYMALANPSMDHRPLIVATRYGLAYVFIYYYVFVYVGCSIAMWLTFTVAGLDANDRRPRLIVLLSIAIIVGLTIGAYIDPLMQYFGAPNYIIEEARLRDVPFWFAFAATGAIVGSINAKGILHGLRYPLVVITALAYAVYASIRIAGIGDAADYDLMAFFLYAALFCLTMLGFSLNQRLFAALGSASYFIYLWHIFAIMILRSVPALQQYWVASFFIEFTFALACSVLFAVLIRRGVSPLLTQWLGA